jgi:hypothetical protein
VAASTTTPGLRAFASSSRSSCDTSCANHGCQPQTGRRKHQTERDSDTTHPFRGHAISAVCKHSLQLVKEQHTPLQPPTPPEHRCQRLFALADM